MGKEDLIYLEEKEKLKDIENLLSEEIEKIKSKINKLKNKTRINDCYDYEDISNWKSNSDEKIRYMNDLGDYESLVDEPYFARMDLDSESSKEIEVCYIGKKELSINFKQYVIDWRSPLGNCYYLKNDKEFTVNKEKYELILRRSLNIKNGKLISYKNEYSSSEFTLDGEVIDPFLLEVLRDKRRQLKLTDIIRTIQSNQNEIIRKPLNESFVVQGCAGSGKTMILLHRLSYLMFNNKNLDLNKIKIITPNKLFDFHINDLSRSLGLNRIERYSVDEYYIRLIKKYDKSIKLEDIEDSEKKLNIDMLEKIYSLNFTERMIQRYHDYWENIYLEMRNNNFDKIVEKYNYRYPNERFHNISTYKLFAEIFNDFQSRNDKVNEEKSKLNQQYETTMRLVSEIKNDVINYKNNVNESKELLMASLEDVLKKLNNDLSIQKDQQEEKNKDKLKLESELSELIRTRKNTAIASIEDYLNYETVYQLDDEIATKIKNENLELINQLIMLNENLSKLPIYNFGKKNELKKQIKLIGNNFRDLAQACIQEYVNEDVKKNSDQIDFCNYELARIDGQLEYVEEKIRKITNDILIVENEIKIINENPNGIDSMKLKQFEFCVEMVTTYLENLEKYHMFNVRLKKYENDLISIPIQIEKLNSEDLSETEKKIIESCEKQLKKLSFNNIFKNIYLQYIDSIYNEYNISIGSKLYRHNLYLILVLCNLYYTQIVSSDNFLNIDEAQDISLVEYKLLSNILGKNCILNLYGDVNQLIYTYKGINDWSDIEGIGSNIYILNENYRNTIQITEVCNKEFYSEIYPIGINGEDVAILPYKEAMSLFLSYRGKFPHSRYAIIYKYGDENIIQLLSMNLNVVYGKVVNNKISILDVEEVKGLEFDCVLVITDRMTDNEKYISYTRALNKLIIAK